MQKNICLITNYNYSAFIDECLEGVLGQTTPFDLTIVVDDGSTDNSTSIIEAICQKNSSVKFISKENGGQLSGFNAAANLISSEDRVFFLDADDVFPPDYLELALATLATYPADFTYCKDQLFSSARSPLTTAKADDADPERIPVTSALSRAASCWFGGPTSCISISGSLFQKIFPYPFESEWKSRADDVIVYASSIIGAKKLFIPSLNIGYRTHLKNGFLNRKISHEEKNRRERALYQLFDWYGSKFAMQSHPNLVNTLLEFFSLSGAQRKGMQYQI